MINGVYFGEGLHYAFVMEVAVYDEAAFSAWFRVCVFEVCDDVYGSLGGGEVEHVGPFFKICL